MTVVHDTTAARPRHPEKAHRPDAPAAEKARLDQGQGAGVERLWRDRGDRARERPAHGLRGGRLPQYRRVLGEEARDLHDHGRHLHARLRVLQRQDRLARAARRGRAGACRRGDLEARPRRTSSSPRSTATTSTTAGAAHFAAVIRAIRARCPATTIEVLTPDFLRKDGAVEAVVAARPDVFNHNLETVPSQISHRAAGRALLRLASGCCSGSKEIDPAMFTKSGIMVGLGEERNEILQVMDDLRAADVDFLTIGQYLQPTRKHHRGGAVRAARRVQGLRGHRLCQGLPDGVGFPADALLAPCRRGFRPAASRAPRARSLGDAAIHHHATGAALGWRDVRSGRRCGALSGIRAAVPQPQGPQAASPSRKASRCWSPT